MNQWIRGLITERCRKALFKKEKGKPYDWVGRGGGVMLKGVFVFITFKIMVYGYIVKPSNLSILVCYIGLYLRSSLLRQFKCNYMRNIPHWG